MARIAAHEVRKNFSDILNRVTDHKERIVIHRKGKDSAVLIPVEDMELIEAMEDRIDLEDAKASQGDVGENLSLEEVKRGLGL